MRGATATCGTETSIMLARLTEDLAATLDAIT
jgi:hypothetical protein